MTLRSENILEVIRLPFLGQGSGFRETLKNSLCIHFRKQFSLKQIKQISEMSFHLEFSFNI